MKAIRLDAVGAALRLADLPEPVAGPGEVLLAMRCAALNRRDLYITQGLYPRISLPCTLGSDGVGDVVAHGAGVTSPPLGTRVVVNPHLGAGERGEIGEVLGMPRDGTLAEYLAVPAANVAAAPEHLTDPEAASIGLAGLTAYRAAFSRGGITRDDVVLLTGIGGGVQTFVLLFAVGAGARVVVTSLSAAKLNRALALGAGAGIDVSENADWRAAARAATDGGPTLVIDSIGGETLSHALDVARPGGRIVLYGGTTGDATIRPYAIFWKQLTVLGSSMGTPHEFRAMLALFETGLRPVVDSVVSLAEAGSGFERLRDAAAFGKIVVAVAA